MRLESILPFHFYVMTWFGGWYPADLSTIKTYFYHLFTFIVIVLMYSLVALQLARLALVQLTFDEFNDTFYVTIATAGACYKLTHYLIHRQRISQLIDMFQEECCLARDDYERSLKKTYDDNCAIIGKMYLLFIETELAVFIAAPLSQGIQSRKLPYETYQFYDMSNPLIYFLSYAHHAYAGILYGGINSINDSILTAFMSQLCAQLDILSKRLENLPGYARAMYFQRDAAIVETCLLEKNIKHHLHIYNISKSIVGTFKGVIVAQFYASTLQICLSVYQLTFRASNAIEYINHGIFLMCMLSILCMYCYFSNKLTVKSVALREAIYNMDWTSLTTTTKKNLVFMICCATVPIEITDGAFVRLNMQTFASVVKLSYSAFNVIKTSR